MKTDLHMHSCHSDGELSGAQLIDLARQRGVQRMSITDHDCIAVYDEIAGNVPSDIELIPGCEFSSVWRSMTIHILGLNLDLTGDLLKSVLGNLQKARETRGQRIAELLEKKGLPGAMEGALKIADGSTLGRPHFAQFMVEQGFVKDSKQAFKQYLGAGKPGDIKAQWPGFADVCQWILRSGGVPVLAHPYKYGLTQTRLKILLADFKEAGGLAMEVISGKQDKRKTELMVEMSERFELYGSLGSDFHKPGQPWADLGLIPDLPEKCQAVWQYWG